MTCNLNEKCLDTLIRGLLIECPKEGRNPLNCPLAKIRALDIEKRGEWLQSLSYREKKELYSQHKECMSKPSAILQHWVYSKNFSSSHGC